MVEELVERLTTNYTYFMREPEHFRLLNEKILPEMFPEKSYTAFYNIWCAGVLHRENATRWPCC